MNVYAQPGIFDVDVKADVVVLDLVVLNVSVVGFDVVILLVDAK